MSSEIYQIQLRNGICQMINGDDFVKSHYYAEPTKYIVYVMRRGKRIFYVGQSGRGLYRCLDGFTAKSNQSIACPWRSDKDIKNSKIEVLAAYDFLGYRFSQKKASREIVEADITAKIFSLSNSWPTKLKQLSVRGNVNRSSKYQRAHELVLKELELHSWV